MSQTIQIVPFEPRHAQAFYALNRAWLDGNDLFEEADEKQLVDPHGTFVAPGGAIFVALDGDAVVGTVALGPYGPGEMQIAKLSVDERLRGRGLGRRLVAHCLARARELGVRRVSLTSNSRLVAAIRLYESFGFTHRAPPAVREFATADVYMSLEL